MVDLSKILAFIDGEKEEAEQDKVTPTMTEMLKSAMGAMALEMRVSMPAEVIRYDHKKQLIDARPFFKRKYNDGSVTDPPIIYNVPVVFPRAGQAFISLPIEIGHSVLLIFSDRSLDKWLSNGTSDEPGDTRSHHISDAMAIPGGYPFSNTAEVNNPKDMILKNKTSEIRVKPNGHLQILNGSQELIKILDDFMTADITGAHPFKLSVRARLRSFLEK